MVLPGVRSRAQRLVVVRRLRVSQRVGEAMRCGLLPGRCEKTTILGLSADKPSGQSRPTGAVSERRRRSAGMALTPGPDLTARAARAALTRSPSASPRPSIWGSWPMVSNFPVETEFAHQFGVSPMTLREALGEPASPGAGRDPARADRRYVRSPPRVAAGGDAARAAGRRPPSPFRDLVDEHQAVAGLSAKLTAERASAAGSGDLALRRPAERGARSAPGSAPTAASTSRSR